MKNIEKYENLFEARFLKRNVQLIIGPTNSGKTFLAIQQLINATSGAYLGPLRLLALEKYEEISQIKPCNLITGEEQIKHELAKIDSQTIETFSTEKFYDTVVIDEVQLLGDPSRGYAYSKAVVGAYCRNLILVGSPNCLDLILKIFERLDEKVDVVRKERLSPLKIGKQYGKNDQIPKKSAIIVFSRKKVFEFKEMLEKRGNKVSTIYGSLSPEVRKKEAKKFASGQADYLIATDAIGMGLNLPIKEIIFSTSEKFDGIQTRSLNPSEIAQISGRAGRFGLNEEGLVSSFTDLRQISRGLEIKTSYCDGPFIFPTLNQTKSILETIGSNKLVHMIRFFSKNFIDNLFKTNSYEEILEIARILDNYDNITIDEKYSLLWTPVNLNDVRCLISFQEIVEELDEYNSISTDFLKDRNENYMNLFELEKFQKELIMFKSISRKFRVDTEQEKLVADLYKKVDEKIFLKLNSKNKNKK